MTTGDAQSLQSEGNDDIEDHMQFLVTKTAGTRCDFAVPQPEDRLAAPLLTARCLAVGRRPR